MEYYVVELFLLNVVVEKNIVEVEVVGEVI